jgi:hypothetical protein
MLVDSYQGCIQCASNEISTIGANECTECEIGTIPNYHAVNECAWLGSCVTIATCVPVTCGYLEVYNTVLQQCQNKANTIAMWYNYQHQWWYNDVYVYELPAGYTSEAGTEYEYYWPITESSRFGRCYIEEWTGIQAA